MKLKREKPIEYYVSRNQWLECIATVAWTIFIGSILFLVLLKLHD